MEIRSSKDMKSSRKDRSYEDFLRLNDGLRFLRDLVTSRQSDCFVHLQNYSNFRRR